MVCIFGSGGKVETAAADDSSKSAPQKHQSVHNMYIYIYKMHDFPSEIETCAFQSFAVLSFGSFTEAPHRFLLFFDSVFLLL